jgi:predicted nucleic acid-binding protein
LLALFTHIDLDFALAWHAGEIRRQYSTRMADALIRNLPLSSGNLQHFTPIDGLRVEKPYD